MDEITHDAVHTLIGTREDVAFHRLKGNLAYQEVCKQQKKSEEAVKELQQQFNKSDRLTMRRHYEREVYKTSFQIEEAYLQGLRDGFTLIRFLSGDELRI